MADYRIEPPIRASATPSTAQAWGRGTGERAGEPGRGGTHQRRDRKQLQAPCLLRWGPWLGAAAEAGVGSVAGARPEETSRWPLGWRLEQQGWVVLPAGGGTCRVFKAGSIHPWIPAGAWVNPATDDEDWLTGNERLLVQSYNRVRWIFFYGNLFFFAGIFLWESNRRDISIVFLKKLL
jgi:hypothetical protein